MSQIGSGRVRDPAGRVRSDQKKWFAAHSVLRLHLDTDPFPSLVENHRTVERKILCHLSLAGFSPSAIESNVELQLHTYNNI